MLFDTSNNASSSHVAFQRSTVGRFATQASKETDNWKVTETDVDNFMFLVAVTVKQSFCVRVQKGLWNIATWRMLEDRGALPRENRDVLREYQATHEKNSQQLAAGGCGRQRGGKGEGENEEAKQEENKSGKTEEG